MKVIVLTLLSQLGDGVKKQALVSKLRKGEIERSDGLRQHLSQILNDGLSIEHAKSGKGVHITSGPIDHMTFLVRNDRMRKESHNFSRNSTIAMLRKLGTPAGDIKTWLSLKLSNSVLLSTSWICYFNSKWKKQNSIAACRLTIDESGMVVLQSPKSVDRKSDYEGHLEDNTTLVEFCLNEIVADSKYGSFVRMCFPQPPSGNERDVLVGQYFEHTGRTKRLFSGAVVLISNPENLHPYQYWPYPVEVVAENSYFQGRNNNIDALVASYLNGF